MNRHLKSVFISTAAFVLLAAAVLAVSKSAQPRIDANEMKKNFETYSTVLEADSFEKADFSIEEFPNVETVAKAADEKGWVIKSVFPGAHGDIAMVTGVGPDYLCTGISILSHSETEGLGAVAADSGEEGTAFRASFVGTGEDVALAGDGGTIDAITGATETSSAIVGAVAEAIGAAKSAA